MRIQLLFCLVISALFTAACDNTGNTPSEPQTAATGKLYMKSTSDTPIDESMDQINSQVKKLGALLKAESLDKDAVAKHITEMLGKMANHKQVKIDGEVDDASKKKYLDAWNKSFDEMAAVLNAVKEAANAGDKAKATAELGKLNDIKKSGHQKFKKGINKDLIK